MPKIVQAIDVLFLARNYGSFNNYVRHGKIEIYYLRTWNLELVIGSQSHDHIFKGF